MRRSSSLHRRSTESWLVGPAWIQKRGPASSELDSRRKSGDITRLALHDSRRFSERMYTFLLVILIIDSIVLVAAILMQSAKGGGLAASFGGVSTAADSFIGTRQAGNVLTKIGGWAGGLCLGA